MKLKNLLTILCVISGLSLMAQTSEVSPANNPFDNAAVESNPTDQLEKTITCQDTVRYPQFKEQRVGTSSFYSFGLVADNNDALSQKFDLGGSNMDINGVEFYGRMDPSLHVSNGGSGNVSLEAAIYSVDANNNPVTQLAANTIVITDTTFGYRYIDLASPLTITTDYAVVIQPTSPGGIVQFFMNDVATGQSYDEDLSRIKSDAYDASNGNWVSTPTFSTSSQWTFGPVEFEGLIAPIVSYSVDPNFTINPNPVCQDDQVTFTNTSASQDILENRMYTYDVFQNYFGLFTADSTYIYDFGDGSPLAISENTTHTYTSSGSFNVTQLNLGGVLRGCIDNVVIPVTVDPLDDATVTYSANQYCTTGTNPTPTINSTGSFTALPAGLVFANSSTGEIDLASTTPGTYDITFQTNGTCPNSSTVTITVNEPATAGFSYSQAQYCEGSGTATATLDAGATAGTFTASPSGLSIDGFTGDVDLNTSSPGTYTVTNTIAASGGCPQVTATQSIEVVAQDDASFAYSSNTICLTGGNETPTINATGTFTSTPSGLVFANTSTGEIDVAGSSAGTYDITFQTNGTCPNSSTVTVTLTTSPDASFSYSAPEFCAEVATEAPTFPSGASAGTFSASPSGLALNTSNGEISLDASTAGTYTVTNTIAASGSCPQTTANTTVTINALPTVNGGADQTVCEGTQVTLTATGADSYAWTGGISQGTAFTPSLGTTTYTVTGTDANNCENTDDVDVTVDEEPVVDAGADQEVCEGEEVTLTATTSVGTISWDNGITDGTPFTPSATTTYTATATNGACSVSDDAVVTVNPLPTVTMGNDQTACVNHDPIALTGNPAGGTFSGTGVSGSDFDPNAAGVGTHVVTYTYQDANGCENTATQTFTVDGCASIQENSLDAIVVAPNPATSFVDIAITDNDLTSVQLVSATGQVVEVNVVIESTKTRVNLDKVAKGTYFLQINTKNGQTTKKLIVQ